MTAGTITLIVVFGAMFLKFVHIVYMENKKKKAKTEKPQVFQKEKVLERTRTAAVEAVV